MSLLDTIKDNVKALFKPKKDSGSNISVTKTLTSNRYVPGAENINAIVEKSKAIQKASNETYYAPDLRSSPNYNKIVYEKKQDAPSYHVTGDGKVISRSGKLYDSVSDYESKRAYAESKSYDNFVKNLERYRNGEISYDELMKYNSSYQKRRQFEMSQERAKDQREYNEEYAEAMESERGILDRIFGVLGYNGIVEGLYNVVDDDESTTLISGLKDGFKYMNPFTDDVSGKHTYSDVLDKTSEKTGLFKDEKPGKFDASDIPRAVYSTIGDVLTDPLTYVGVGVIGKAGSKILKGSGYTTDVVSAVKKGEGVKTSKEVADSLRSMSKNNVDKFKQYTGAATADDFIEESANINSLYKNDSSYIRSYADNMAKEYNDTVARINFDGYNKQGVTPNFRNLNYSSKKASALRNSIERNEALRKFGDYTIAPYYNSLAKNVRNSSLARKFQRSNLSYDAARKGYSSSMQKKLFAFETMQKQFGRIMADSDVKNFSIDVKNFVDTLSEDELYDVLQSFEDGTYRNMRNYNLIRNKIFDDVFKVDESSGELINKHTGEYVNRSDVNVDDVIADYTNRKELDDFIATYESHPQDYNYLKQNLESYFGNFTDNDRYVFKALSGRDAGFDVSDTDIVNNVKLFDKYKSIGSWKELLLNNKVSNNLGLDSLKKKQIKNGDEAYAKEIAMNLSKEQLREIIDNFVPDKQYTYNELQAMSWKDVSKIGSSLGYPKPRNMRKNDYIAILAEKYAKSDEISNIESLADKFYKGEETISKFIDNGTYDFYKSVERILNDDYNADVVNTYRKMNVLDDVVDSSFSMQDKLRRIDELNNILRSGANTYKNTEEADRAVIETIMERMWQAAKKEIEASGFDPAKESAYMKHRYNYLYHTLSEEAKKGIFGDLINEDRNGNYRPTIFGVKDAFSKARKDSNATIPEINADEKILEDALHEIVTSRLIQSNRIINSKNVTKFMKDNFSKPVDAAGSVMKGYIKAIPFDEINELFQEEAGKRFQSILTEERLKYYRDIFENPHSYGLGELADRISGTKNMISKNEEMMSSKLQEYIHDVDAQRETRIYYNNIRNQLSKNLSDAEKVFQSRVNNMVEEFGKKFTDDNMKTIMDEEWQKLADEFSGGDAKRRTLFAPNIVLQPLTDEQAMFLQSLKDTIKITQYDDNIVNRTNILSRTQKADMTNKLLRLYDGFLQKWKIGNTLFSPAFHVQNALSNAFQSFLGIGADAFNVSKVKRAYDVMRLKDPKQTVTLNGKAYTYKEIENFAKEYGVIDQSFAAYDFGKGKNVYYENGIRSNTLQSFKDVDWSLLHPFRTMTEASTVVGTNLEGVQRLNMFMSAVDQGYGFEDAAKKVDEFLFDYSDLSEFEQDVMKRIIPFYTFMRKNIPLELKQMLLQPQKFVIPDKALTNIEKMNEDGYVPENNRNVWRQNYTQIPFTEKGINLQLPYYQLDRLYTNPVEDNGVPFDRLVGSMSPLLKAYPELSNEEYFYTGMPVNSIGEYLVRQSTPTSLLYSLLVDEQTGEINDDIDLTSSDLSRFLFFPIDDVQDVTVNKTPLYDTTTGEYIGSQAYRPGSKPIHTGFTFYND